VYERHCDVRYLVKSDTNPLRGCIHSRPAERKLNRITANYQNDDSGRLQLVRITHGVCYRNGQLSASRKRNRSKKLSVGTTAMTGGILYIVILATLTVLTFRKPHIALVAVLCMFGLEQLGQLYIPFLRSYGMFTNLYVLLLVGVAVMYLYFSGRLTFSFRYRDNKVRNVALALFLFAFISLAWSRVDGSIYWVATLPYVVVSLIMAPMLINRIDDLEEVQNTFVWMGGALTVFMAFVPTWGVRSLAASATGDEVALPLALAQLSGYLLIVGTIYLKKSYANIGWLILVVVAALTVAIKSGSRGQLIFSILSLCLVTPIVWKRFTLKNALQLAATGVLIVFASSYILGTTDGYSSRWEADGMLSSASVRLDMVEVLLSEWISSPVAIIFGLGNSASFSPDLVGVYPHIVLLEVLGEEGIIGLALFVMIVLLLARQLIRFNRLTFLSKEVRKSYAAIFGCFLFTLLLSFKQGSLITSPMIFFFAAVSEKYFYLVKLDIYRNHDHLFPNRTRAAEHANV